MGMYGRMVAWQTGSNPGDTLDRLEGTGAVDLDKDWDVVLRLLEALSDGQVMSSMVPVGDEIGYGPAQLISADVVAELTASSARCPGRCWTGTWHAGSRRCLPGHLVRWRGTLQRWKPSGLSWDCWRTQPDRDTAFSSPSCRRRSPSGHRTAQYEPRFATTAAPGADQKVAG